jgi:uncharacterized protein (TIGR03905 family)
MEKTFRYNPQNVCSREMIITYENDTITGLKVVGGCPGNLQGEARLVKGRKIEEVITLLEGIRCPGSRTQDTSCPDQLAQALKAILASEAKK